METLPQRKQRAIMPQELGPLRPAGAYTFDELYRFAQMCHASDMFEDVADAAQAMIKIVRGQELGLPPTTAMTAFDIIQKRLFIKPWAIAAKINACGYGGYEVLEQTAEQCTIQFLRKYPGRGWVYCPPLTYTLAEAEAHGLTKRSPHWRTSPAHMLYQRCMGRGGAMYFPELLAGIEPPLDDTPIPPERHAANVVDLFGDHDDVQASLTAARQSDQGAQEAPQEPREGTNEGQSAPDMSPETSESNLGHSGGKQGVSRPRTSHAWQVLRDREDDARVPVALRAEATALLENATATEGDAFRVSSAIEDYLQDAARIPAQATLV